jgi:glycosyltransferase involved in cell wall biosynthesis
MAKVIYLSFNSITEPLVHSQVLSYLQGLQSYKWQFILLTAEGFMTKHQVAQYQKQMKGLGIEWHAVFKTRLGTIAQIYRMYKLASVFIKNNQIALIHARSYFSGTVAYLLHKKTRLPYIYDIRGFWVDEKVYKGRLQQGSVLFRVLKYVDSKIYKSSSGIVSLTSMAVTDIKKFAIWDKVSLPAISVIPTCVNTDKFKSIENEGLNFIYLGSVGQGYMGDVIFKLFHLLQKHYQQHKITLISRSDKELIKKLATINKVDLNRIEHLQLTHDQVPMQLGRGHVGLSFIQNHFSKRASCATKIGEYLSCGMPVLCNSGIGDMDVVLTTNVSVICDEFSEQSLLQAIEDIVNLSNINETSGACVELSKHYFSLKKGIKNYHKLYNTVITEY